MVSVSKSYSLHIACIGLFFTKLHENIFDGFLSCSGDIFFLLIISEGHNSVKYVNGVLNFFLCISSDNGLYLF